MHRIFSLALALLLPLLPVCGVFAQQSPAASGEEEAGAAEKPKLRPELESLLDAARGLPVEYFADVTFRVLEAEPDIDPEIQKELLAQVFERAGTAARSYSLQYGMMDPRVRDVALLFLASWLRLDEISIRIKATQEMARLDTKRALAWAESIALPTLPAATCESFASPETDSIFEFLATSAEQIYEKQGKEEDYYNLLRLHVSAISSPLQLPGAARMLTKTEIEPERLSELINLFANRVAEVRGDPTTFLIAVTQGTLYTRAGLLQEMEALMKRQMELGGSPDILLQAFRGFLADHLRGARCANGIQPRTRKGVSPYEQIVQQFNEKLLPYGPRVVPPLDAQELQPESIDTLSSPPQINLDRELEPCLKAVGIDLMRGTERPADWKLKLDDCLSQTERWEPAEGDCRECSLAARAKALFGLIQFSSDPADSEYVAASFLRLLEGNVLQVEQPANWLICLKLLLNTMRTPAEEDKAELAKQSKDPFMRPHAQPQALRRMLEQSRDRIISLYGRLEQMFPQSFSIWVRTMRF